MYTRRYDVCKVMNYTTDKMPHWFLYIYVCSVKNCIIY